MILSISCSSPVVSVALIGADGSVTLEANREAKQNASGACLEMIDFDRLNGVELIVADVGPGSFIGCRVGVTLAKAIAFAKGLKVAGVSSFDLIDPGQPVALPSKRGEWFVRRLGHQPYRTSEALEAEFVGYGTGFEEQTYPHARRATSLLQRLRLMEPEQLLPQYLIEPSISLPKGAYPKVNPSG